jgi:hypothetical protein
METFVPLITEPSNKYDFFNEEKTGEKTKYISWFYIKKGIYISHNFEVDKTVYNAIREDEMYGILYWDSTKNSWRLFNEKVQNLYKNWKADKILLSDGD